MKVEIEFKCKADGNNRILFSMDKKKDIVTIETFRGAQHSFNQISYQDFCDLQMMLAHI